MRDFDKTRDTRARRIAFEVKEVDGARFISGYAATFENPDNYDSYGDIIHPNAFDKTIAKFNAGTKKIKMLSQHSSQEPIGLWTEMSKDDTGLIVRGRISAIRAGDEMLTLVKDGVIDSLSIGFFIDDFQLVDYNTAWGTKVRELLDVDVDEVSPVTFPANENAKLFEVRKRQTQQAERQREDFERKLFDLHMLMVSKSPI